MKTISSLLPLAAALGTLGLVCGCSKQADADTPQPTLADNRLPVRTQPAATGAFVRSVRVQGTLESVNSAIVSARIDGPLLTVDVDLGDAVQAGVTRLFSVDPVEVSNNVVVAREVLATAKAQVTVAEAQLQRAEAVAEKAKRDAERYERLHKEGRVSDNEAEQAELNARTATADTAVQSANLQLSRQRVSQYRAELAIAERELSDAVLLAPIDGIVNARNLEPGEQVSTGTAVITINGTKELKAMAYLPAQYYSEVKPGSTTARLTVGGKTLKDAVISAKSPAVDPRLRTFEIKALLPGSDIAVPGAMADFEIILEERNGLSVPESAVLNRAAGTLVFVDNGDGTARACPVTTGLRTEGRMEILSGLSEGDAVIVKGQTQLYDGRRIDAAPLEADAPAADGTGAEVAEAR